MRGAGTPVNIDTAARAAALAYTDASLAPLNLKPQAEPAAPATGVFLYVDEADGIAKLKYPNGDLQPSHEGGFSALLERNPP